MRLCCFNFANVTVSVVPEDLPFHHAELSFRHISLVKVTYFIEFTKSEGINFHLRKFMVYGLKLMVYGLWLMV